MELSLNEVEGNAYQNFVDSVRDKETFRKYDNYLYYFLNLIPNDMFSKYLGHQPASRELPDLAAAFTDLAKLDVSRAKSIIQAYVRNLKKEIEEKKLSAGTARNRLKPIKALLKANNIDISWYLVDKSLPKVGTAKDRAYRREELQMMMRKTVELVDKIIITCASSGGFRVEAWRYFTWNDLVIFYDEDKKPKGGALRVYAGDIEEYWTHITPEACLYLEAYKDEWKNRFMQTPAATDPLLVSVQGNFPKRLSISGIKRRTTHFVKAIGMRPELEDGVKRHEVMIDHGFRKYHNTMLRRAKVNFADKEDMQGRNPGGQERSYERYEESDFERFEEYEKAILLLTISDEERAKAKAQSQKLRIDELEAKEEKITQIESKLDLVTKQMHTNQSIVPTEENLDKMIKMLQKLKKI